MKDEEEMFKKVFGESVEETLREASEESRGSTEQEGGEGSQFGPRCLQELVSALCERSGGGVRPQEERREETHRW